MYSFVIPAHNEGESIARCVRSIHEFAPPEEPHEVIVVDHESTDETARLAAAAGARVLASHAPTIGAARNEGVACATGDLLVFLDADCVLTPSWLNGIRPVVQRVREAPIACAGAQVYPPDEPRVVIWRHWFHPFALQRSASHVGSAHLFCRRDVFLRLGGFDPSLSTGEDFEFCTRLVRAGGVVMNDPALRVDHHGFPRTIGAFVRRERWHGRGDTRSLGALLSSKVAVLAVAFVSLALVAVGALAVGAWSLAAMVGAPAVALLVASGYVKFGHAGARTWGIATLIFIPYFVGRALAVADALGRFARTRLGGGTAGEASAADAPRGTRKREGSDAAGGEGS